jgi:hypothetical protein
VTDPKHPDLAVPDLDAGSPPYTLLALGPDGRVAAAWAVRAPTPAAALIQLAELATSSGLDGYAIDPSGWRAASTGQPGPGEPGWPPTRLAALLGTPPAGWPLAARARWAAQYALTVQAPLMARPGLVFHGTPGQHPGTGDVAIETRAGGFLARLANAGYARSPAGFGWGHPGSISSWALARSVLAAALGRHAGCATCGGTGRVGAVGYGAGPCTDQDCTGQACPEHPRHQGHEHTYEQHHGAEDHVGPGPCRCPGYGDGGPCPDCDGDGIAVPPAVAQAYAEQVISVLPAGEWRLRRAVALAWLETQLVDEDMYRLARMVEL